jgi:hypothetical protein
VCFIFVNTHFSVRTNVIETIGGLGSVNVVHSHPDSFPHLALLGRKFLLGYPHDDGPYLALPSLFLQTHPEAHQTHQKRVAQTQNHPQIPCGLHPLMIVHVFSSLPHLAFVHPQVERRMAETHQSIFTYHLLKVSYHCSTVCNAQLKFKTQFRM